MNRTLVFPTGFVLSAFLACAADVQRSETQWPEHVSPGPVYISAIVFTFGNICNA